MLNRRNFLGALGAGSAMLAASGTFSRAFAHRGGTLRDGAAVSFRCLGHIRTPTVFLDGRTLEAAVGLAPAVGGNFSGALWRVAQIGSDVIALECLGDIPGNRWLDGRTVDATVGLASSAGPSGTAWRIRS